MEIFSKTTGVTPILLTGISDVIKITFADLAPIVALIIGMILTFILARYIMGLFKHAGSSTGQHNIKSDLNMYHYSDDYMKEKGINPMGISEFDEGRF